MPTALSTDQRTPSGREGDLADRACGQPEVAVGGQPEHAEAQADDEHAPRAPAGSTAPRSSPSTSVIADRAGCRPGLRPAGMVS